jgi:DNA polymerase-3 subunit epsilon
MDFIAIDVETANPDLSSICQVGLVSFKDNIVKDSWESLVDPEDYFDGFNVLIHGIDEKSVKEAPIFPEIQEEILSRLRGNIVVSHTSFDRVAIARVFEKYELEQVECIWLDSAKVVRRAWAEFSRRGYGLENVASKLGIVFEHHNAKEDARAAGEILIHAIKETGLKLQDWLNRVKRPISLPRISVAGNPEGLLYGEVVVFTGALSIPRRQAAEIAASSGCEVAPSVNKTTTLLVVGDQDIRKLAGHEKSSKHRKAEKMIAKGHPIRILSESDFQRLVSITG